MTQTASRNCSTVAANPEPGSQACAAYLKKNFIDQGKLGVATGEGFYRY